VSNALAMALAGLSAVRIRVEGTVQGVGFRPNVWRLAGECELAGFVLNDGAGVLIEVTGADEAVRRFIDRLGTETPPLSRVDRLISEPIVANPELQGFRILESLEGEVHTPVAPDAGLCPACREEIGNPIERRFRYPFTNCTHCGPRFSIINAVPYDRGRTTMAEFAMCPACAGEYRDPSDRRFHAQPIACHTCGPKAWLERLDGRAVSFDQHSMLDDVDAVTGVLKKGEIVAIKGLGGFHLACDATNDEAVGTLRRRKRRYGKPFALMARDLDVIRSYCAVGPDEEQLLESSEAPIVVLKADGPNKVSASVALGLDTLGFMLPYTPLHRLVMRGIDRPVVMTSGNISDEPQIIENSKVSRRLQSVADYALFHDRQIANRVDDSVVRVMAGKPRLLRRARGYAPGAIPLPPGFERAPDLLAFGAELKSTFCLVKRGAAILSQHQGDLENIETLEDFVKNLCLYTDLFQHRPKLLVVDRHPEYLSTKLANERASDQRLPLLEVQHHHAHIASCLAEHGVGLDMPPVIGVALDGLGMGDDGALWGGEFLLADYRSYQRLGTFKPVAMLGGAQAVREPWRSLYAHLMVQMGWPRFVMNYAELELYAYLKAKPRGTLDAMLAKGINSPLASSCGRLFDAVAAAVGLCRDEALFEGQGAMELEAAVDRKTLREETDDLAYPIAIPNRQEDGLPYLEPLALWQAILGDLILKTPAGVIAARFHKGLAKAVAAMVEMLAQDPNAEERRSDTVALSGGCFQNKILLEETMHRLEERGFRVLAHARVPANDGGLALGQAAIGAAHSIKSRGESHVSRNSGSSR